MIGSRNLRPNQSEVLSSYHNLVVIMKSFEIIESQLDECINYVGPMSEHNHRFIYHILCQLKSMGEQHRDEWRIILMEGDHEAEMSETYAEYLDRKACGEKVWFDPEGEGTILFEEPIPTSDEESA